MGQDMPDGAGRCKPWYPSAVERMTISKFKAACSAVLERVQRTGLPIQITRYGKPVAKIVPVSSPLRPKNWLGSFRSSGRSVGDIVSPTSDEEDFGEWSSPEDGAGRRAGCLQVLAVAAEGGAEEA